MGKWNLKLDDNLVELEARTLEPEVINYSDRSVRYKKQEADWSRDGTDSNFSFATKEKQHDEELFLFDFEVEAAVI